MIELIRERKKAWVGMITLSLILVALYGAVGVSRGEDADYSNTWEISADGTDDKTDYYSIERIDNNSDAKISVKGWISNKTAILYFDNIEKVDLYLNETDINPKELASKIKWGWDSEITIILKSEQSTTIDFNIHSVPDFKEINLDGDNFEDYSYNNDVLSFSLSMSEHEISLLIDGLAEEILTSVITIFWLLATIRIIVSSFEEITDEL